MTLVASPATARGLSCRSAAVGGAAFSHPPHMPPIDAKLILAVLGPLFLVLAALYWQRGGAGHPKARTWVRVGLIFTAVAAWLWWSA
jgi:hypothetical protein